MHKPENWSQSGLRWLWLAVAFLVVDQATKIAISHQFDLYQSIAVMPFFNLTYVHNEGAAFSFLSEAGGWQRWFFSSIAIGITGLLLVWLRALPATAAALSVAYSLVIAGALGNLIDRLMYGYVIDFIDLYVGTARWPAFNVADAAICVGAALIMLDAFKSDRQGSEQDKKS